MRAGAFTLFVSPGIQSTPDLRAAILHHLAERFKDKKIYTFAGHVLLAINPYQRLPGLYGPEVIPSTHIFFILLSLFALILSKNMLTCLWDKCHRTYEPPCQYRDLHAADSHAGLRNSRARVPNDASDRQQSVHTCER